MTRKNQQGSALVVAVMTLFILLSLGFSVLAMTDSEIKISNNHLKSTQALYLAEAGIAEGIDKIMQNPSIGSGSIINKNLGEGSVEVSLSWSGIKATLTSVGKSGGTKRTLKQELDVIVTSSPFDQAIVSFEDSSLSFGFNGMIDIVGDINVGVPMYIDDKKFNITGNIFTDKSENENIHPKVIYAESISLPDFPEMSPIPSMPPKTNFYDITRTIKNTSASNINSANFFKSGEDYFMINGNVELTKNNDKNLELNNVYIECNYLKLDGEMYSGVTFIVNGSIDINSAVTFENVTLIADSINFNDTITNYSNGAVYASGNININQSANFTNVFLIGNSINFTTDDPHNKNKIDHTFFNNGFMQSSETIAMNQIMHFINSNIYGQRVYFNEDMDFDTGTIQAKNNIEVYENGTIDNVSMLADEYINFHSTILINSGYIACKNNINIKDDFYLKGFIIAEDWINIDDKNVTINGGLGAGGVDIGKNNGNNKTEIIYSDNTGAPLPAEMGGVKITKIKWSEG